MPHPGGIFLRLASCVRCEGGSVADMWCCDARSTQRVWANASTLMAAEYALLPHREGGAYCQSSRESYTDRSQQLSQAATPVPGLEVSFRKMSVIGLLVASLSPFGLEARSKLVAMFRWS